MSDSYYDDIANEIWTTWCEKIIIEMFSKQDPDMLAIDESHYLGYIKGFKLSECKDKFPIHSLNILTIACERLISQDKISIDTTMRRIVGYVYNENIVQSIIMANLSMKRNEIEIQNEKDLLSKEIERQEKKKLKNEHNDNIDMFNKQNMIVVNNNNNNRILIQQTNNNIDNKKFFTTQYKKINYIGNNNNNNKFLSNFVHRLPLKSQNDENNMNYYERSNSNKYNAGYSSSTYNYKIEIGNENIPPSFNDTLLISNTNENFKNIITINEINLTKATNLNDSVDNKSQSDKVSSPTLPDEEMILVYVGKLLLDCFENNNGEISFNTLLSFAEASQSEWIDSVGRARVGITTEELQLATQIFEKTNKIMIDGDTLIEI